MECYHETEASLAKQMHIDDQDGALSKESQEVSDNSFFKMTFDFDKNFNTDFTYGKKLALEGYLMGEAHLSIFQKDGAIKKNDFYGKASLGVGTAAIQGEASGSLFQNKKFDPYINIEAQALASLADLSLYGSFHKENVSVVGEADIGVGVTSAKLNGQISKDKVSFDAECGVAAVKGKATGAISIFGFTIEGTVGVEIGAIGIGAKFNKDANSIEFGGKCSNIFGLDLSIKISY